MYIAPNDSLGNEVRGGFLADLTGKIDGWLADIDRRRGRRAARSTASCTWSPSPSRPSPCTTTRAKVTTAPATTDELMAAVKDGAQARPRSAAPYFGWGLYGSFGGKIFDDTGKCVADQTTGVANAIKYVADLKAAGALVDADYGKVNDAFKNGKVDVDLQRQLDARRLPRRSPGRSPSRRSRPAPTAPRPAPMAGVDGWYINSASQEPGPGDRGRLRVRRARRSQTIYVDVAGHVPANKSVDDHRPARRRRFADAINQGMARPQTQGDRQLLEPRSSNAWNEVLDKGDRRRPRPSPPPAPTTNKANGK